MAIINLPAVRLTRQRVFPARTCRDAGTSLVGVQQRIGTGIKIWELEIGIAPDWEPARIKAFEAFIAGLTCSDIVRVPLNDMWGYDSVRSPKQEPFSDGTWFSDGTGWITSGTEPLVVTTGVNAGGNVLTVDVTAPPNIPNLSLGDYFSHNGFLYCVTGRTSGGWVKFAPNARRPIAVGDVLDTDPAYFCGYPVGDDFGSRGRDIISIAPAITLSFVEAFDR